MGTGFVDLLARLRRRDGGTPLHGTGIWSLIGVEMLCVIGLSYYAGQFRRAAIVEARNRS